MRIGYSVAVSLLAASVAFAPAWAQDPQQAPPQSDPSAQAGAPPQAPMPGQGMQMRGRMGTQGGMAMRGEMNPRGGVVWRSRTGHGRFAQMRSRRMNGRRGPMAGMFLARMVNDPHFRQRLGITDEQAQKIRQQTTEFRTSHIRSRADVQVGQVQLRALLAAQNPDRAAIDQKLEQISAAQLTERKQQVDYMLALRDALTPEQRQKLQDMRWAPMRRGMRTRSPQPAPGPKPDQPNP